MEQRNEDLLNIICVLRAVFILWNEGWRTKKMEFISNNNKMKKKEFSSLLNTAGKIVVANKTKAKFVVSVG